MQHREMSNPELTYFPKINVPWEAREQTDDDQGLM